MNEDKIERFLEIILRGFLEKLIASQINVEKLQTLVTIFQETFLKGFAYRNKKITLRLQKNYCDMTIEFYNLWKKLNIC